MQRQSQYVIIHQKAIPINFVQEIQTRNIVLRCLHPFPQKGENVKLWNIGRLFLDAKHNIAFTEFVLLFLG